MNEDAIIVLQQIAIAARRLSVLVDELLELLEKQKGKSNDDGI